MEDDLTWIRPATAARLLGVSIARIVQLRNDPRFRVRSRKRPDGRHEICREDIEAYDAAMVRRRPRGPRL